MNSSITLALIPILNMNRYPHGIGIKEITCQLSMDINLIVEDQHKKLFILSPLSHNLQYIEDIEQSPQKVLNFNYELSF